MNEEDVKTEAIVLRRVNYAEADRILTLLTPGGKISAMAKGVRKARSKLAGGVEMLCLSELCLHKGRGDFFTLTSARMKKYYSNILKDFERMEVASKMLKKINAVVLDGMDEERFFVILKESLEELNNETNVQFVWAWFLMNVTNLTEGINLYRDTKGVKLVAEKRYDYHVMERAFYENERGEFGADEIKYARLMVGAEMTMIKKVIAGEEIKRKIFEFAKLVGE